MFLGHFGLAFAAKRVAPGASLGTTIVAAQALDLAWPVLVLAGVERVEIAPGITRVTPLDFVHYPYTHSLVAAVAWAALVAGIYMVVRGNARAAAWVAALVASHWFLDWVVHRPDLLLYPGEAGAHGLGLWNSLGATLAIELALFAGGVALYVASTRALDRAGRWALVGLVAFLALVYAASVAGPPPPSPQAVAWSGVAMWLLVAWGYWIDRHRRPREARP
jgi:membrane-bound metal-dependent hydrolase YbcI (DUF457 family)